MELSFKRFPFVPSVKTEGFVIAVQGMRDSERIVRNEPCWLHNKVAVSLGKIFRTGFGGIQKTRSKKIDA